MQYPYDDTYTVPFVAHLIEDHHDTLSHLIMTDIVLKDNEIISILCSKLKTVELLRVDVQCFENPRIGNTSIETLVLGEHYDDDHFRGGYLPNDLLYCLVQNCQALRSLEIRYIELSMWWTLVLSDMEWLTHLKLKKCDFKPLPLKAIEKLEILTRRDYAEDWVPAFIRMNPTLETVNVPAFYQNDELFTTVSENLEVEYNLNGGRYQAEPKEAQDLYIVGVPELPELYGQDPQ